MAGTLFASESVTEGHPDTIAGQSDARVLQPAGDCIEPDPGDYRPPLDTTGRSATGGPASDAGPTGRRAFSDTYGGTARHVVGVPATSF